jgi:hypothetical protein
VTNVLNDMQCVIAIGDSVDSTSDPNSSIDL